MCVILCDELSDVECSSASQSQHGSLQLVLFPQVTPTCQPVSRQFGQEEAVPVPPLASFFPCKLCGKWVEPVVPEGAPGQTLSVWSQWEPTDGLDLQSSLFLSRSRMFYKIKSRNAHMKIHRQPQEDWTDRRLQQQFLTQRLALSRPTSLMPTPGGALLQPQAPARTFSSPGLPGTQSNADSVLNSVTNSNGIPPSNASVLDPSTVVTYSNIAVSNSHVITNNDGGDSNQREPTTVLPFHQSWGSFGPDPATFYCSAEGKDAVGAGTVGGKEPVSWQ